MPRPPKDTKSFSSLMQIVADLRGPNGCPWDRVQTHQSLAPFAIEEAYELAEILDHVTDEPSSLVDSKLKDELGDLLFQVARHAQIAQERKAFTIESVVENVNGKMIRRHPHVFAESEVKNVEEVWTQWEKIKATEKAKEKFEHGETGRPDGLVKGIFDFPPNLPALQRAYKIGTKAQKRKFDWQNINQVQTKLTEELAELQGAIKSMDKVSIQEELGDVLFTVAQIARPLEIEPEQALRKSNLKFEPRFELMLKLASERDLSWNVLSDTEKDSLWNDVKTLTQKS